MLKLIDEWTFMRGASKHAHAHTDTHAHTHSPAQDLFHTLAPGISTLWLIHYTLTDPSSQRTICHSPPLLSTKPFSASECTLSSQPVLPRASYCWSLCLPPAMPATLAFSSGLHFLFPSWKASYPLCSASSPPGGLSLWIGNIFLSTAPQTRAASYLDISTVFLSFFFVSSLTND